MDLNCFGVKIGQILFACLGAGFGAIPDTETVIWGAVSGVRAANGRREFS